MTQYGSSQSHARYQPAYSSSSLLSPHCSLNNLQIHPISLAVALLLGTHGLRKGSLSPSGAAAALLIGYFTLANPFPGFGIILIAFYLAGSRATKVKADVKARLEREQEVHESDAKGKDAAPSSRQQLHKSATGGQRDAWQVICNGLTGCLAAVVFRVIHSGELNPLCLPTAPSGLRSTAHYLFSFLSQDPWQKGNSVCAVDPYSAHGWSRGATMVVLGHFACCMGDVLASELGILSKSPPRLITSPWRIVPPGTNGGISLWGTIASALGGTFIGLVLVLCLALFNPACFNNETASSLSSARFVPHLLAMSTLAGFTGSMLDSLLGALTQRTWYNTRTRQVLLGRLTIYPSTLDKAKKQKDIANTKGKGDDGWTVITGWDILTNGQVNFISSLVTAIGLALLDRHLIRSSL